MALAECAILGGRGVDAGAEDPTGRLDAALFGEEQSRFVISARPADELRLQALAAEHGVSLTRLGTTGGDRFRLTAAVDLPLSEIVEAYEGGLAGALAAPLG